MNTVPVVRWTSTGLTRCNYTKRFFKTPTVNHFHDDILLLYTILLLCGAIMTVSTSHLRLTPCPLLPCFYLVLISPHSFFFLVFSWTVFGV
ncbi:hypothetical protein BJX66DRAFT_300661 [Aspergillus keveii]|uniref:Uncharacterized protein n=1 Tax=Aspergillus keveii TaxID=714993 RepID=A0ABR4GBB0_9EURO